MKLGCNTIIFGGADLAAALDGIAWAGYEFVELAAVRGMCEHVPADADADAIRRMLADAGLTATAMEGASVDPARVEELCALAERLGVPLLNIGSGGASGDEETTKAAIENIGALAEIAGRHGVRLAVKPHVGQAIYNGATALRLMDEVRHPALGLNFDPSHLYRADEDPPEVARRWAGKIITSHFRDCASRERQVGPPPTQIPGRGAIDLPATLAALAESHDGPVNLEIIGAAAYPLHRAASIAAESRGYLGRCLEELVGRFIR